MSSDHIRIVSRESPLALWQANFVKESLLSHYPHISIEILGITTQADRSLELSLEALGGKGAFVKELELALLNGDADLAVHSMKDVTIDLPGQLTLCGMLKREDPRDVLVSNNYSCIDELPQQARIGTSSLRRKAQLRALHPDFQLEDIRGNVGTRLAKLDDGQFDALVLAAAGVKRLGLSDRISETISANSVLPAVGQGAMGIEIRADDEELKSLLAPLSDFETESCVLAERAVNRRLGGDCHVPIAAYAQVFSNNLNIEARVARLDGSEVLRATGSGSVHQAEELGDQLGQQLLHMGAADILSELENDVAK